LVDILWHISVRADIPLPKIRLPNMPCHASIANPRGTSGREDAGKRMAGKRMGS
jgi:hypothetical protein